MTEFPVACWWNDLCEQKKNNERKMGRSLLTVLPFCLNILCKLVRHPVTELGNLTMCQWTVRFSRANKKLFTYYVSQSLIKKLNCHLPEAEPRIQWLSTFQYPGEKNGGSSWMGGHAMCHVPWPSWPSWPSWPALPSWPLWPSLHSWYTGM